jgi:hypothetical protein
MSHESRNAMRAGGQTALATWARCSGYTFTATSDDALLADIDCSMRR